MFTFTSINNVVNINMMMIMMLIYDYLAQNLIDYRNNVTVNQDIITTIASQSLASRRCTACRHGSILSWRQPPRAFYAAPRTCTSPPWCRSHR